MELLTYSKIVARTILSVLSTLSAIHWTWTVLFPFIQSLI